MQETSIYKDIAERTDGDIYIGVVGPVRTGKSTFIKSFMEALVLPLIENPAERERARDELPQSGSGKTVMTAEPKFVPENAVKISLDNARVNVRLVDCVGYMVDGALGATEDGETRMVHTPWFDEPVDMIRAAEEGTHRVVRDHSTVALVVTCDGSIADIPRESYRQSEDRVINELKALGKPFAVLVNSRDPSSRDALATLDEIRENHGLNAVCVNCAKLDAGAIADIIRTVLFEFPISDIEVNIPSWIESLENNHWLKKAIFSLLLTAFDDKYKIRELESIPEQLTGCEHIEEGYLQSIGLGDGKVIVNLVFPQPLFYKILSEKLPDGMEIENENELPALLTSLSEFKRRYSRFASALDEVYSTGYGIVMPTLDELKLDEPEIIHQGGRFGVKLSASAPSVHMLLANIESTVSPIVGSEKQSEELVDYLLSEFEDDPSAIWESNIFGKSLHSLINEGLAGKLQHMPDDARVKLRETLERIINEGGNGLICILI